MLIYRSIDLPAMLLKRHRDVQEPESDPEQESKSSKFFRSRIELGVKFNVKTGVEVGAGVTIFLSYYCNVN